MALLSFIFKFGGVVSLVKHLLCCLCSLMNFSIIRSNNNMVLCLLYELSFPNVISD